MRMLRPLTPIYDFCATNRIKSLSLTSGRGRRVVLSLLMAIVSVLAFAMTAFAQDAVQPTVIQIDVVPGAVENRISLGISYAVPVAILSNAGFDAATVNPETLTLSGGPVSKDDDEQLSSLRDVNEDGLQDMLVYFAADYTELNEGTTEAILQGNTNDGTPIRGTDYVQCSGSIQQQAEVMRRGYIAGGLGFATIMANPGFVTGYVEAMYNYVASFFTPEPAPVALAPAVDSSSTFTNTALIAVPNRGTPAQNFTSGSASPYPSEISVSNVTGVVKKVTVTLNGVSHLFPDDIDILLVGPTGKALVLMSDAGGNPDITNLTLTFDDAAANQVQDNGLIASPNSMVNYQPTNHATSADNFTAPAPSVYENPGPQTSGTARLSVFNGLDPNGTWKLFIRDDTTGDVGNIARGWSLTITTEPSDTTAPTLTLPSNMTVEATSASGAVVTYTATATDADPANPAVNCTPASGGTFAITTTTVNCSATDTAGNTANGSFTVTVRDTTAPVISTADMTVNATSTSGAVVTFSNTTAGDTVDSTPTLTFNPPSGSTFPIGTTTVNVTAKDDYNNTANTTFDVTVNKLSTSITGLSNPTIITYGQPVPQTASVQGGPVGAIVTYAVASGHNVSADSATFDAITNPLAAGNYTLRANYAGNAIYSGSTAVVNLTVNKAATTTTVSCPANATYTGSAITPCTATVTGAGLNQSLTVSYANNVNAGAATASATYAESANHLGSSDSKNFTIDKAATTTVVSCPTNVTYIGSAIEPCTATVTGANLNAPVAVAYSNNLNAGTATATATYAESANHLGSSDSENFTINKAATTTIVNCPPNVTYTGSPIEPCSATVTGAGGLNQPLAVTYGNNVNAGTATAGATYTESANHLGSGDSENFTINKAATTTTVSCPTNITYTGAALEPCTAMVTGAGGLNQSVAVTYANNVNAGTTTAGATYAESANHLGSTDSENFTIDKASSATVVTCPTNVTYTGAAQVPCTVAVTGAGGLNLTPAPTYANNVNAGTATASYTFAGGDNHNGSSDSKNFTIDKAATTTTVSCPANVTYTGSAIEPCTATVTGANLNASVAVTYTNNVNAGAATAGATYAESANHLGSSGSKNFTIDKAPSTTVVSGGGTYVYDSLPHPASVSVTGAGGLNLNPAPVYSGNCSSAPVTVAQTPCTASYTYAGGANHLGSSGSAVINITALVTTTTVTVSPNSQQYSDKVTFTATVAPGFAGVVPAATGVTFYVGTQNMGSATLSPGVGGTLTAALPNIALLEGVAGQMSPGNKTVTAIFGGVNPNFMVGNAATTLTMTKEDARAYYTGALFVNTAGTTSSTATTTLSATVRDITAEAASEPGYDANAGDIRNARVTFVDRDNGNAPIAGCSNLPVQLVSASDIKTGTVTCSWSANIGSSDSEQYTIGIVVNNYYARDASTENAVVTVSKPIGTNFITGGGYLVMQSSAGQYAGAAGSKNNFGFNVKYNKSGTSLQGRINVIVRAAGGKVYQIKGNQMETLSANNSNPLLRTAIYTGKANLTDITDPLAPVSLGGGHSFQMKLTDKGEPGNTDTIGFTLYGNNGGALLFSSNWSGTQTVEQILGGGNLVIR